MSVTRKVKSLLVVKNMTVKELAERLNISSGALNVKLYRGSFSAEDLIRISLCMDCELAINIDDSRKIVFDAGDIREREMLSKTDAELDIVEIKKGGGHSKIVNNGVSQTGVTNIFTNEVNEIKDEKPKKKILPPKKLSKKE